MKSAFPEPEHPGKILEEEILWPLNISANVLAKRLDVPVSRISEIIRGRRGLTADTALRLGRLFGTSADLWLGMQTEYELRTARKELGDSLERDIEPWKRNSNENDRSSRSRPRVSEVISRRPADRRRLLRRKSSR